MSYKFKLSDSIALINKFQMRVNSSSVGLTSLKKISKKKNLKPKLKHSVENRLKSALILNAPIAHKIVLNQLIKPFGLNVDGAIQQVIKFHDECIINHSVVEGSARFNLIRNYSIKLLEGQSPDSPIRVAVGKKDRWPSAFDLLRPLFYRVRDNKCQRADRVIRSILYLNRLCDGNGNPDFSEISKSFDVSQEFKDRYESYVKNNIDLFSGELITKPSTRVLSNGPNGKPKWQTADVEAYALLNSELNISFKDLCLATGNNDLYECMRSIASKQNRVDRKRLRYITTIRDKGNKCRLVAISDYWTQVLLEPIMNDVKEYTKTKFRGVSYSDNHAKGFDNLKKFIRPGVESYDISSWTDAFPSSLQLIYMKHRYGANIATAWYNLVVSCKWNVKGSSSSIKYERGQGMGTNGSFDIATITDLFLLEMIYKEDYQMEISVNTFNKVGDDLWCYDPDKHVLNTYTQECGIDINTSKTKSATKSNLVGEFVSRSLNNGHDVSRISANICRAVGKNILELPQLASHLEERNYGSIIPSDQKLSPDQIVEKIAEGRDYGNIIPIDEIFSAMKIRGRHRTNVVRTLYILCLMYPRHGLDLLKRSLEGSIPVEIYEDEIICIVKTYGVELIKDTFFKLHSCKTIREIEEKMLKIFKASQVTLTEDVNADSDYLDPNSYWISENIPLITSKIMMSESYRAHANMFTSKLPKEYDKLVTVLEETNQAMTFKDLGIISEGRAPWRPKATKLFNLIASLTAQTPQVIENLIWDQETQFSEGGSFLITSVPEKEFYQSFRKLPIAIGTKREKPPGISRDKGRQ